ncbi:MAG TPA: hypothetical protein VFF98_08930 [Novosphingobium sp.]|nr:hypothetical protein [Novosphingobium sp.]HZV09529.1 hypothetical protein [Novosphingobium sp.]
MAKTIAFLACADTLPGAPHRRPDAFEHDHQVAALRAGLAGSGTRLLEIDWRAPLDEICACDLALVGTPWDYTEDKAAFLARLEAIAAAGVPLWNPLPMLRWNADKLYLAELEALGAPSIPTLWHEAAGPAELAAAFTHFGGEWLVAKRRVGAGAVGQALLRRGSEEALGWRADQPVMIQPFLPAIRAEGELSFIFVDGALSHALVKRAQPGDYRIQAAYGGRETALHPAPADRAAAEAVLALLPFAAPPLYARIDMLRLPTGALALIEAELIEPYLYPLQGPHFGRRMAQALLRRL